MLKAGRYITAHRLPPVLMYFEQSMLKLDFILETLNPILATNSYCSSSEDGTVVKQCNWDPCKGKMHSDSDLPESHIYLGSNVRSGWYSVV